ncbi:MAG: TIGR00730 family Rossman fold protein [Planctomycetes bacterium]|nr:TIGR00730 family Rossman fold protein [Planctomycetota bacterium]
MANSKTEQNAWRMFRIMGEFVAGFQQLSELPKAVTIFGSARTKPNDPYYKAAEAIAAHAVERGFPVISGGGPGIMEAANKGAAEANGQSVGLCIRLPNEQSGNRFINVRVDFHYFFVRKVMFLKHTCAVVVMPGGFGTLDELFECATLVQTRKITPFPIILYGKSYWHGLLTWIKSQMDHEHHYISHGDMDLLHLVDSPEEAAEALAHIQVEMPEQMPHAAPMD